MKKLVLILVVCFVAFAASPSFGLEVKSTTKEGSAFARSPVTLHIDIDGLTPKLSKALFCSGDEFMRLPSIGTCPPRQGYDTVVGIASCTQMHRIPKKMTFTRGEGGLFIMTCTLDYAAAEPTGELICDYSRCMYSNSPAIWPTTFLDGVGID